MSASISFSGLARVAYLSPGPLRLRAHVIFDVVSATTISCAARQRQQQAQENQQDEEAGSFMGAK